MKHLPQFLRFMLGIRRYHRWRAVWRASADQSLTDSLERPPDLNTLGRLRGTDKSDTAHTYAGLTYLDVYARYLPELPSRGSELRILEIGVREGASLRTWSDRFPDARIFGIDIDPSCKRHEEAGIHIAIGSQKNPEFLRSAFPDTRRFDLIVDDGSHINSMTLAAFDVLFAERLKPGGIYVIEDLGCSYDKLQTHDDVKNRWPGMHHNDPEENLDNDRRDMDRFFLDRIRDLDHLRGDILFIHFWSRMCVIQKRSD